MTTLPVAFRPKDGAELVWTADQTKLDPVVAYSGVHGEDGVISIYARDLIEKRPTHKRDLDRLSAHLRALALNYSPMQFHAPEASAKDYLLVHIQGIGRDKARSPDYYSGVFQTLYAPLLLDPIVQTSELSSQSNPVDSGQLLLSGDFAREVIAAQAEGQPHGDISADALMELRQEVTERVEEAIADIGYRWVRRKRQAARIFTFGPGRKLQWCDQELAKLLVFELNIAIISAQVVFESMLRELVSFLERATLHGDWGSLQLDGPSVLLVPPSES